MTFGTVDHVLVALTVLMDPLVAIWAYRRMTAILAAGDARARTRSYRRAIVLQLSGAAVILVLWLVLRRPLERLVSLPWLPEGWWTAVAWGVVLLACAVLIGQLVAIRGNETELSGLRKQMTSVEGLLPRTPTELKLFFALSLAAGVGEEIVFRGYLLAYFDSLVGPAGAVLASSLIFGVGHTYQGAAGIVKTGIAGLLFAGAYVATGSLLAPMLLHAVTDAVSGMAAYLALRPATA
jgi:membrane protease YdiL (CAAX protease family)